MFDNDGTLWCEKPMYIQLDFLLRRFKEQAEADPALRDKQPYQAAYTGDLKWLGDAVTKHYQGDDTDLKVLDGSDTHVATRDHRRGAAAGSTHSSPRPSTRRWVGRTPRAATRRWCELLRYLEDNGFTYYIVSGGGRDFMRPVTGRCTGFRRSGWSAVRWVCLPRRRSLHDGAAGIPRRRADEAGAAVEPHRASAHLRGGQLQRRHRDARVHPRRRAVARSLHDDADREFDYVGRRGEGARAGAGRGLDGREHARTTGRPSLR